MGYDRQGGCRAVTADLSTDVLQTGLAPAGWVEHAGRVDQQIHMTKFVADDAGRLLDLLGVGDIQLQQGQLLRMLLLQGVQRRGRSWIAAGCDDRRVR